MSIKLDNKMKNMISDQLSFIATEDGEGHLQIGPKGSLRVFDDESLIYNEHTGKHAWDNVQKNSNIVVATVDRAALKGYRFEGIVEIHQDDDIYKKSVEFSENHHMPKPIAAVLIKINSIYSLDAGPNAGTLLKGEQ